MKTIKWTLKTAGFLLMVSMVMVSCKKKKTAPTLTLNGATQITLCLGETYTEEGASAVDAYGDDIDVVITGDVDVNTIGNYTVTYTATDKNDNVTTAQTTVAVGMCASSLMGDYTVSHDCTIDVVVTTVDICSDNQSVIPGSSENEFIIDNFNDFITQLTASVDGSTITIPSNTFNVGGIIDITISGVGTVNETGTEMVIDYSYDAGLAGSGTCTATYTKL